MNPREILQAIADDPAVTPELRYRAACKLISLDAKAAAREPVKAAWTDDAAISERAAAISAARRGRMN